jgi:predicted dehydrogenase
VQRDTPFRLAIVGCGKIASSHAEAALESPLVELAALVDPAPERARALAERFGIAPTIATDVSEVRQAIDGAVIATPNHTHAPLAETCLASGVPVLIEKPLALTPEEGARICTAAERAGLVAAVGYVSRFRQNVQLMGELIRGGYFGAIHQFAYQFGTKGGWAPVSGYNLDRRATGGGVLVTTGTHFLDRMLDWFGYPNQSWLVDDASGGPEANAFAYFSYGGPRAFTGLARFSKTTSLAAGFVMETDRGTVLLKDRPDASVVLRPKGKPEIEHAIYATRPHPGGSEFLLQLEDFVAASRGQHPPMVTARQGQESMRLLDELYNNRRTETMPAVVATHPTGLSA